MERAASPRLRNSSFVSTRRYSTGMTPYHSLSGSNHSKAKRRLELDDEADLDAPHPSHPSPPSAVLVQPVRAVGAARMASATFSSSVFHQQSSWSHRRLDNQVLESNRSDHARHSRLLDFSNHSQKPATKSASASASASGSVLAPPGRRVDSGDDERLEAPTRCFARGGGDGGASLCGGESTAYGGSDDKSLATLTSLRSRSVMSRQHSLLSLDNASFSTELHVLMQRQASQSSLCSFASHAIHKRRNSWGSTCGASVAGEANVPPFLLRLTSASSALDGKGGAASVASVTDKRRHAHGDDDSTGSWLRHVTSIRRDTTTMTHLRQERLAGQLHSQHRPANPITADAFWLQQMSSRSLSSFTTITTTTTTRTTTNNATPPLPAMLSMKTPSLKGASKTPYPSPEEDALAPTGDQVPGTSDGTGATLQDPHQRAIPRNPGLSLRYSPEQPPYYHARRTESAANSSIRSLRFSDDDDATIVESVSASSQPAPLTAPQQQQQQYQPPLPLQQIAQGSSLHQERLSAPHDDDSGAMELDETGPK